MDNLLFNVSENVVEIECHSCLRKYDKSDLNGGNCDECLDASCDANALIEDSQEAAALPIIVLEQP
jgi:hypothetical protein